MFYTTIRQSIVKAIEIDDLRLKRLINFVEPATILRECMI